MSVLNLIVPAVRAAVPTIKVAGSVAMRTVELGNLVYVGILAGAGAAHLTVGTAKLTSRLTRKGFRALNERREHRRLERALDATERAIAALQEARFAEQEAFHQATYV